MIDIKKILNENKIPFVTSGPNTKKGEISVSCPFCKDDPSFHMGIDPVTKYFACWRNKKHSGKNIARLFKLLDILYIDDKSETLKRLLDRTYFDKDPVQEEIKHERIIVKELPMEFVPLRDDSVFDKPYFRYLSKRGFRDTYQVSIDYNLHRSLGADKWTSRIIIPIPIEDEITWTGRAIGSNPYRYLSPGPTEARNIKECIFNYNELSQTSGEALIINEGPLDCYSEDTEVLTQKGWKLIKKSNIQIDLFATRNSITHEFEWQQATDYIYKPFFGKLINLYGKSIDLLVTPSHRVLVASCHTKSEKILLAKDLLSYSQGSLIIPSTSIWKGNEIELRIFDKTSLPKYYNSHKIRPVLFTGDDYCAFMGMYLSEGCIHHNKEIQISQKRYSKGWYSFNKLLERIFGGVSYSGGNFHFKRKALAYYLQSFGLSGTKFIPKDILNASSRQLQIFWDYYFLGDGSGKEQLKISSSSSKMMDGLQELLQKIGRSGTISAIKLRDSTMSDGRIIKKENCQLHYSISSNKSRYHEFNLREIDYKGHVTCISVPNGVLYVRRNKKPIWCGNSLKADWYNKKNGIRATCLFGLNFSDTQIKLLENICPNFNTILVGLDQGTLVQSLDLSKALNKFSPIIINLPKKDMGEMEPEEMKDLFARYV